MPLDRPARLTLAVNPAAHAGLGDARAREAATLFRARGAAVTELRRETALELAAAVAADLSGPDAVVVVGGDGAVNLVANVLAGTGVPLGVVPAGTGNDVARLLGVPLDSVAGAVSAVLAALDGAPRLLDLGRIDWPDGQRHYVAVASAGFDARVNERANTWRWPRGQSRYTLAVLRELVSFRPIPFELTVDGVGRRQRAMLVSVANGPSLGGGMRIAPGARADDGLLDLFVVRPLSIPAFLAVFPKVFRGEHVGHPAVELSTVRSVSIGGPGVVVYADGERVTDVPVTISVVPRSLAVLAAPGGLEPTC
ncbi:diacylglycerol kinase family protein [Sinomonas sp. ASV486]|uniref:Diacylglycerol kinase family protein n=1 Tax=Sinomonas puerhi TaxID=3238584 RepID=A0AB39L155_9MICC|nr:diacylglycerol kinase family protein [Sinomonas sp. ASV486]MDQ4491020.1 diacylglycerol kinase family protein [Sinomonas sp. ASV486]